MSYRVLSDSPINITLHSSSNMSAYAWDSHRTTKDSTDKEQDPPHKSEQHDEHKLPPAPDASTEDTPAKPEDVDAPKLSLEQPTRPSFPSHFDSDKKDTSASFNFSTLAERTNSSPASMPHRVEPYPMTSSHRRHYEYDHHHRRPSPPPITTLPHSPTPSVSSLDRSAVSTPPIRRSPPLHNQTMPGPPPHLYASPYPPDPALLNRHFRPEHQHLHHGYMYAPPPPPPPHHPMDQRPYDPQPQQDGSPYHGSAALPPHMVPTMRTDQHQHQHHHYGPPPPQHQGHGHAYPGQPGLSIVHTDDAATKLSDRVRRRCFNCCTTDTSTWRRSNLSPGKVLCNKCGLFERTHSRPRPEQFPHKRGPLSTSTLRARTPPQTQLPPMSPGFHYTHPPPPPHQHPQHQHQGQQHQGQQQYQDSRREYTHAPPPPGSVAASHSGSSNGSGGGVGGGTGNGNGTTLPGLQTWHHEPGTGSPRMHPPPPPSTSRRSTLDNTGPGSAGGSRGASPPLSRPASGQGQGQGQGGRGEGEQPAASASAAAAAA
ncbi:hypothetical protein FPV67DRAFT_583884 [Lyophyllum atratum]|nr:hypothetical protein FPV67DRAFT_583884 [Lyophyllum atratum]